ncbi:hypothetical protein PQQ96_42145, partial [Paraburkholderia sediminicola]|uniref:hypothetical protein n=1 Tax=Paraburkholderia sediminicola TaxID=458836 RepID=UPI0038BDE1DD
VAFLRGLLRRKAHPALSRFDFIPAFGEGNVAKLLTCYPRKGGVTPILGALDGDVRNSFSDKLLWPYCFLPGDLAPEKILIEKFKENLGNFCADRDIKRRSVDLVFSTTHGLDYHDVIGQLTRALPFSHEDIVNFVVRCLDMDSEWTERISQFFESLEI